MSENSLALDTAQKSAISLSSFAIFLTLANSLISTFARRTEWRLASLGAAAEAEDLEKPRQFARCLIQSGRMDGGGSDGQIARVV